MLLECTSSRYISPHSPASDQKGKSSSSQPPASQSRQVSLWRMLLYTVYDVATGVCCTLLFLLREGVTGPPSHQQSDHDG